MFLRSSKNSVNNLSCKMFLFSLKKVAVIKKGGWHELHEVQSLTARKGRLSLSIRTTYTFQKIVLKTNWIPNNYGQSMSWTPTQIVGQLCAMKIMIQKLSDKVRHLNDHILMLGFFSLESVILILQNKLKINFANWSSLVYRNFIFRNRFLCKLADLCSSNVCQASKPY